MSEREFDGLARVSQMRQRGMVTLRGDLASTKVKNAATGVAGVDFPGQGQCNCVEERGIAWMSPDELLVMCPHDVLAKDMVSMQKTLKGTHHLLADVSDARALFLIEGAGCREVLAKLCPVDLSPRAFKPGQFRRTRIAQVPCAFWMRDAEAFELVAFSSVADYVWGLLCAAADPAAPVGHFG